ncbi:hypothetical protein [Aeoliella sp.]|uniref:hypothetical protein n=1 Tax=Aeoliella sp. TaxID=2795800 RepID=UPI003CCB9578
MELELKWADAEDGILMVNSAMQHLIVGAAEQRRKQLLEYIVHVEAVRLSARNDVERAAKNLQSAKRRQSEMPRPEATTEVDHAQIAQRALETRATVEELKVSQASYQQRIDQLDAQIASIIKTIQEEEVNLRLRALQKQSERYRKGHEEWNALRELGQRIMPMKETELSTSQEYYEWRRNLNNLGGELLPPETIADTSQILGDRSRIDSMARSREQLQLEMIPLANRIELYERRLASLESISNDAGGSMRNLTSLPEDVYFQETDDLQAAETRLLGLTQQLENMRQLAECPTPEFAIHMEASMGTTTIDSNKKKLFAMYLVAAMSILALPILGVEWLAARDSPVAKFASRWGLPLVAERLLSSYTLGQGDVPDWRFDEAVRMTTLRIQQCANKSGFVVLFSNLAKTQPPARLMSAIAECLAHREERVLIVDAMCPSHLGIRKSRTESASPKKLASTDGRSLEPSGPVSNIASEAADAQAKRQFGLADFLSRECEEVTELIQPTTCAGVDQISAGKVDFPHEAMASSCITELFAHCRKTYSVILVAGPPVTARADFQLLASRADGILLAASRASVREPANREAVQDLIELQAPMLGVVG